MDQPCAIDSLNWFNWHPPVGFFIAVLALLGVLVPLFRSWGSINRFEKAVWTACMFVLMFLEIRTLYLDRNEHDVQQASLRCEELHSFERIATALSTAITAENNHFDDTMKGVDRVFKKTERAASLAGEGVASITGADSYLLITPHVPYPVPQDSGQFALMLSVFGKYTVWDGSVAMREGPMDEAFYTDPSVQHFNLKPITNTHLESLGPVIKPSVIHNTLYSFSSSSRGSSAIEVLEIRFEQSTKRWEFRYWLFPVKPTSKLTRPSSIHKTDWTPIPEPKFLK